MEAALRTIHEDIVSRPTAWRANMSTNTPASRDYWTQQWATIESHAEPVDFSIGGDGTTPVEVHLTRAIVKAHCCPTKRVETHSARLRLM
jgi:hypothetical protein